MPARRTPLPRPAAAKRSLEPVTRDVAARPRPVLQRVIESEADIRDGIKALRRKCPVIRRMHDTAGDPPLRRREPGFEGLARIIVGQQVSVASANAIWERTCKVLQPLEPHTLLLRSEEDLRGAGLSRPKIRTLIAISHELVDSGLALEALGAMSDEEVHDALTRVSGIGPWTVDVFLLFCLGRADAFASGDLALQVAAQMAMGLDERPSARELIAIAERWRPWRGVAARLLWAYYKVAKAPGSGLPV